MNFFTPTLTPLQTTLSLITANVIQHLIISYHKIADVQSGRLAPSSLAELAKLDIVSALLERGDFVFMLLFVLSRFVSPLFSCPFAGTRLILHPPS
ncbi:hypothetical protein C8J57DRAFT_1501079 [Mycena rebaudengoi]|nr:hypothetical protein C8J57DRAFT_1501079 [Mycena rebaudengoi]